MNMNPADLQQVRSTPLFAELTDAQLGCLDGGEIIEAPVGTVLASEGERTGFFHVLLEGEVRFTRRYDRQSILLGVNEPGDSANSRRIWDSEALGRRTPRRDFTLVPASSAA